jgi:hypothetical protein
MSAIITGRSGTHNITNVRVYNYPFGSVMMQTCRFCDDIDLYTNLGTEIFVTKLAMNQVNGKILFMIGMKRDVIYDTDGSFNAVFDGGSRPSSAIIQAYNHIASH